MARIRLAKFLPWLGLGSLTGSLVLLAQIAVSYDLNFGSVHLLMGNPSKAVQSADQRDNYLMIKPQYALAYNASKGIPNWVSWQLGSRWLGDAPRQDNFRPDPDLPVGFYRVTPRDYTNSGFDRGHMISSEDRGGTVPDNSATFLMTNIVPQAPDNNRGPWLRFEAYCRELVSQGKELYIVTGPHGMGGNGEKGPLTTLTNGKVTVPASTWKVVLVLDQPGTRLGGVTEQTRTIAIVVPNEQGLRNREWRSFRQSVDAVEQLTGYDFFSNVPTPIQDKIEAKVDDR